MDDTVNKKSIKNELKIIIIGDSGPGKTSFFAYKIFDYKNKFYRVQLWDLAGQDKSTCITKIFAKDSHGCVVLCDITNKDTIEDTLKWKSSVDDSTLFLDGKILPCILIQNKIDLLDDDVVQDDDDIKKFADDNKFDNFFRTSPKTGIGINECMNYLIQNILERIEKLVLEEGNVPLQKERGSLVLEHPKVREEESKKGGCCY